VAEFYLIPHEEELVFFNTGYSTSSRDNTIKSYRSSQVYPIGLPTQYTCTKQDVVTAIALLICLLKQPW